MLIALALKSKTNVLDFSIYNLRYRLPGYLILFATCTFVTQCQFLLKSCLHFRYSFINQQISPFLIKFYFSILNSSKIVFKVLKILSLYFYFKLKLQSTDLLHLIITNNTCPSRITAAAGTSISRDLI